MASRNTGSNAEQKPLEFGSGHLVEAGMKCLGESLHDPPWVAKRVPPGSSPVEPGQMNDLPRDRRPGTDGSGRCLTGFRRMGDG